MKEETYNWLWKEFEKTIAGVENGLDAEKRKNLGFRRIISEGVIWDEYNIIKDELKEKCYDKNEILEAKIDQHKIAACFCKAFINKKSFAFDCKDGIDQAILLSNYVVAYSISLKIIYLYLIDYCIEFDFTDSLKALKKDMTLKFPRTSKTHDVYNTGRVKTLALNDYHGVSFDLLAYADMMYWIDYYNKLYLSGVINVQEEEKMIVSFENSVLLK